MSVWKLVRYAPVPNRPTCTEPVQYKYMYRYTPRKHDISHFFGKSGSTSEKKSENVENPDVEEVPVCSEDESRVRTGTEGADDESRIPGPAGNIQLLNWMMKTSVVEIH